MLSLAIGYGQFVTSQVFCMAVTGICIALNLYWLFTWKHGLGLVTRGGRIAANIARIVFVLVYAICLLAMGANLTYLSRIVRPENLQPDFEMMLLALIGTSATYPWMKKTT